MSSAYAKQYKIQSPLQISGCQLWLDGADPNNTGTPPANGTTVSTWTDKSGNSRNATTTAGTLTYSTSSKSIVFNGSSFFSLPNNTFPTGNNPYTIIVVSSSTLADYHWIIGGGVTTGGQAIGLVYYPNGTIENGWWTTNITTASGIATANQTSILNAIYDSTTLTTFFNGVSRASSSSLGTRNSPIGPNIIGARIDSTSSSVIQALVGNINEIIVFNSSLSSLQREQIEGYLAWKWGLQSRLPTSHPYYSTNAALFGFSNIPLVLFPTAQTNKLIFNSNYPASVSGLSMWFDAADRTTITLSGTNVSQWNDKSGKGNNLSAASARPTYTSNARNNLNVVTYDGTQNLTTGSISANNFAGGTVNLTTFVVFSLSNTNTGTNYSSPFCWANGGGTPRIAPTWEGTANGLEMDVGSSGIRTSFTSPALATNNTFYFLSYWKNGATTQLNVNGSNGASGTGQDTTNYGSCNFDFNVGNGFSNSQYFMRGNIGELIFFSTTLNTTNFQKIEGYLAYKWGLQSTLPTTHPYYSSNSFNLSTFTIRNYDKYAQQNKSYFIDSPLWFSFGIPTSNFSSTLPIQLNGNASYTNSILQLTPNTAGQVGSAFYRTQVRITKWSTQFNLRFDSTQADGTTFCIQTGSATSLGSSGGGLGYLGINNSVAIRFDTYNGNASPFTGVFSTDVLTGGTIPNDLGASGSLNTTFGVSSGGTWNFLVRASYDGTTLRYTIQNFSNPNQSFTSNRTINIGTTIGSCNAFIGFTSATGGATEACSILSWSWSNEK